MAELPSDIAAWTVPQVGAWLESLHFPQAAVDAFHKNAVSGGDLLELSDADLQEHLGLTPLLVRQTRAALPLPLPLPLRVVVVVRCSWAGAAAVQGCGHGCACSKPRPLPTKLQVRKLRAELNARGVAPPADAPAPAEATSAAAAAETTAAAVAAAVTAALQAAPAVAPAPAPAARAAAPGVVGAAAPAAPGGSSFAPADLDRYAELQRKTAEMQGLQVGRSRCRWGGAAALEPEPPAMASWHICLAVCVWRCSSHQWGSPAPPVCSARPQHRPRPCAAAPPNQPTDRSHPSWPRRSSTPRACRRSWPRRGRRRRPPAPPWRKRRRMWAAPAVPAALLRPAQMPC